MNEIGEDEKKKAEVEEWYRNRDEYHARLTNGTFYKKIWNYFLRLVKTEEFISTIAKIRAKYGIPPQGFPSPTDGSKSFEPDEWIYKYTATRNEFKVKVKGICHKYGLHFAPWEDHIQLYIFYNTIEELLEAAQEGALCTLADLANEKEEPFSEESQEADIRFYPLAIRISPHASERDIIEFVRLVYKRDIKPAQDQYIVSHKLPNIIRLKGRKPSVQERDDFIYQSRELSQKEIKALVKQKFGTNLEYAYIGKIISRENKRRQKV